MLRAAGLIAVVLLSGCAPTMAGQARAMAEGAEEGGDTVIASGRVMLADGQNMGTASVLLSPGGAMTLELELTRYPLGVYGLHVHAVGRCEGPGFTTAGPHWNPLTRQHGRLNPQGTHHGDLPNLAVGQDGIVQENYVLTGAPRGEGGLLDDDGAAVVIHANVDDERTDPSGNSGARIACAVLTPRG